jgi:crossover junction endodeoxyribonuclease RuvC
MILTPKITNWRSLLRIFRIFGFFIMQEPVKPERIILGIDPGTNIMGYGVIAIQGRTIRMIALGVLKLSKYDDHMVRLKMIFDRIVGLNAEYQPVELAIEAPFFGKNVQSMLKLGRAQGVAIAAALSLGMPVHEYSPRKVKQSITGKGSASKEQVAAMLVRLLNLRETPESLDATDALAVAVCHYFQQGTVESEKKFTGWKGFVTANPDRAKG